MSRRTTPYGSWKSPISAQQVAEAGTGSGALPKEIQIDQGVIYWVEQRPQAEGRYVIVRLKPDGTKSIVTPAGYSVRSRVHEYGGGVYCVQNGVLFFVNDHDQRIYRQEAGGDPYAITPQMGRSRSLRYADGAFSPDGRWMLWVRERHDHRGEVHNEVVLLPIDGSGSPAVLISGHDFFSNPRFSPDGESISWLCWDHPRMPWDGTELFSAPIDLDLREIGASHKIAGGQDISIFQPEWGPDGLLYFVSDQTGWWNVYRRNAGGVVENICPIDAEFGYPQWLFGFTKYAFLSKDWIIASYKQTGQAHLGLIDLRNKHLQTIPASYTTFENPSIRATDDQKAWFFAGAADHPPALCRYDHHTGSATRVLDLFQIDLDPTSISTPEHIEYESPEGGAAYAYYYPPQNQNAVGPDDAQPPLIVMSHGGPTSSARPHLDLEVQFWTSRGYAVVDVDYAGSIGYGRAYRERLNGRMGVVDVADCVEAARFLARVAKADPRRLIVRGSSAGGFVSLCGLTFYEDFAAGGIYYGIADLEALAQHTHKFESHYLDTLVGPYPEQRERYVERSPINHTDRLNCPMILLQGLDDLIVPPQQSEQMADALAGKGLPYAYLTFENESHGFDRSDTIEAALNAEVYFYSRIMGISVGGELAPVEIRNLKAS